MTARLLERRAGLPATPILKPPARSLLDPGYGAISRLTQLRDAITAVQPSVQSHWNEPPVFFFDRHRQAELESTYPATTTGSLAEVASRIAAELPVLCASVEVRRVARAVDGLKSAAESLALLCPAAGELAALLAVPDDEVLLVLNPGVRSGFRLIVRGVADIGQFHILLADTIAEKSVPERLVSACREIHPAVPAGVPMVAEAQFQMYTPAALQSDATLPVGFGHCEHWLWPTEALASAPRVNGERVILLGPPAYRATWEVTRRFPAMATDVRMLEELSPFRVAEQLARLTGNVVPPLVPNEQRQVIAKAA